MNPLILPQAIGKYGFSALIGHPVGEKENSESKPVELCLKIDPVSHPARAEELVNTHINKRRFI